MTPYTPPTQDQLLAIRVNAGIEEIAASEKYAHAEADLVEAIVDGVGQFAAGEFAPLNRIGDLEGAKLENGVVRLPDGFKEAYDSYVEQGWNAIASPEAHGGQGLPFTLSCNVLENLGSANMAFCLLPMLSVGAIEALEHHGSADQQATYLPDLVSGKWSGTMNLTEPAAGSDVGALRSTAVPIEDGADAGKYKIKGQKIYITWGEHELAENIIHLVLARLPDAPEGSRGISLFVVPKYHVNADGSLGNRNDLRCVSLEHKLGINASPTCVMSYGDNDDCIGELVGQPNRGLMAMFTMMNNARINVGNQGTQIAERATQQAISYAADRVQSARAGSPDKTPVAIIEHPDVRRMILRMKSLTEAVRALLYYCAGQVDRGAIGNTDAASRAEVLVPLLKAWGTDIGVEVAGIGIQIHGGMGFVEETGAAQHWRDSRIAPIYEGTNGIQAADLVTRKLGLEGGEAMIGLFDEITRDASGEAALSALAVDCANVARWMRDEASLDDRLAGSVPFCTMAAVAVAGWQMMKQADAVANGSAPSLAQTKPVTARFFLDRIVPEAHGLKAGAIAGSELLYAISSEKLAG
uniref:acyl-CoA dehydrogenase n=1 Tax=uncultured Erythrobacter sp. TaxID=263913 RepID=UPI0026076E1D|nr:acyl-CoA dehydrogenase [uncultured Erythrobacter sp.]